MLIHVICGHPLSGTKREAEDATRLNEAPLVAAGGITAPDDPHRLEQMMTQWPSDDEEGSDKQRVDDEDPANLGKKPAQSVQRSKNKRLAFTASEVKIVGKSTTYVGVNEAKTRDEARAQCKLMGGDLAVLTKTKEQDKLKDFFKQHFGNAAKGSTAGYFWIGVAEKKKANAARPWKWISGETIANEDNFLWHSDALKKKDFGCLILHQIVSDGRGGFCSAGCNNKYPFLCEIEN